MTRILAIDTALDAVSACVYDDSAAGSFVFETIVMQRGQAEALMPLLDRVVSDSERLQRASTGSRVTVGPGSFTGLRVGIAAARAIGIACRVPVVGVSTLAALAAPLILAGEPGLVVPAIDAKHGSVYFAVFGPDGRALVAPRVASVREAVRLLGTGPVRLAGSGAPMLAIEAWATRLAAEVVGETGAPDISYRRPARPPRRPARRAAATALSKAAGRQTPGSRPPAAHVRLMRALVRQCRRARDPPPRPAVRQACARIHAQSFPHPWSAEEFESLLAGRDVIAHGRAGACPSSLWRPSREPVGFVLSRRAADQAEILTIAVTPKARGKGHRRGASGRASADAGGFAGQILVFGGRSRQ